MVKQLLAKAKKFLEPYSSLNTFSIVLVIVFIAYPAVVYLLFKNIP